MLTSPFARQLYVAIATMLAGMSMGGAATYPMVLFHQLKANDSTIEIDFETSSWIGSIHGFAGIPSIFLPALMQWKGRKFAFITACLISITGWIIAITASNVAAILVSESCHGIGNSSLLTIMCLTISEMMAPKYRETYMQIFYTIHVAGMALNGLLTQYLNWRIISIIWLAPMVATVLLVCTWPESPYWLAYKGEFDQCEKAFIWLRGSGAPAIKELTELKREQSHKRNVTRFGKKIWKRITKKDFYVPAAHITVLELLVQGSGTIVALLYSIDILEKTTYKSISNFGGLIMNSAVFIGFLMSLVINRYLKKKTVMLWSISIVVLSLMGASAFSFAQSIGSWPKESFACLCLLVIYVVISSIGILSLTFPIASSLMPVENRDLGGALMVINTCLSHAVALKSAPYMFLYLNLWGTLLVYASVSTTCGLLIWIYVPEIHGRTLQEIENYYTYGQFSRSDDTGAIEPMISRK